MLVKIFKKKYTLQLLILAIVPIVFWIQSFAYPPQVITNKFDMPLYKVIYDWAKDYQLFSSIIAFVFVFLQGLLLNQLLTKAGREEIATMVTIAGLIIVLLMVVDLVSNLFENVKRIFNLY